MYIVSDQFYLINPKSRGLEHPSSCIALKPSTQQMYLQARIIGEGFDHLLHIDLTCGENYSRDVHPQCNQWKWNSVLCFAGVFKGQGVPRCSHRGRGSCVEEWTGEEGGTFGWCGWECLRFPVPLSSNRGACIWRKSKGICKFLVS